MKVRFTPSARLQFLRALEYIRRKAEANLRRLEKYPESGLLIPEFPELPHREVIISPYRFFYRIEKKTVWIIAVLHGAQKVE